MRGSSLKKRGVGREERRGKEGRRWGLSESAAKRGRGEFL